MKKKLVIGVLITAMFSSVLAGCGKGEQTMNLTGKADVSADGTQEAADGNSLLDSVQTSVAGNDLFSELGLSFDAVRDEEYNAPMYNLPEDYVFEFEASDDCGSRAYSAFKVCSKSEDFEDQLNFGECHYENGKLTVKPNGTIRLSEDGARNTNDGTWGSYNKMYLVQYCDLETGEDLDKPVITPFTIAHDYDAPILKQKVDEKNCYYLSWSESKGASKYVVYKHFGENNYDVELVTDQTSCNIEDFASQKDTENYEDLVKKDLQNAGYKVSEGGTMFMNSGVRYDETLRDGYFAVVAFDDAGNCSGVSNIVDVRDLSAGLPYKIQDNNLKVTATTVSDIPTYVNVEMVDGSVKSMLIEYHGAKVEYDEQNPIFYIHASVVNTIFSEFMITVEGLNYDEVKSDMSYITEREDQLNVTGGSTEVEGSIPSAPSKDGTDDELGTGTTETTESTEESKAAETVESTEESKAVETVESTEESKAAEAVESTEESKAAETVESTEESKAAETVESTEESKAAETTESQVVEETKEGTTGTGSQVDESKLVTLPDGGTTYDLYLEALSIVKNKLNESNGLYKEVLYADSELEAWIALNLLCNAETIPVPVAVFPEVGNTDYLEKVFLEAYFQNPSCGALEYYGYSYEYESLLVTYQENSDQRFAKMSKEMQKAKDIAGSITNSSMSEQEKAFAINDYLVQNGVYNYDGMTGTPDAEAKTELFLDAHSPYGILVDNYGVCESYAEAFCLIARFAGLDAVTETGKMSGGNHEWSRVKIDGTWYVMDVTSNDCDEFINTLCAVSDETASISLAKSPMTLIDPNAFYAPNDDMEYYRAKGLYVETAQEASAKLAEILHSDSIAAVRVGQSVDDAVFTDIFNSMGQKVNENGTSYTEINGMYLNNVCFAIKK